MSTPATRHDPRFGLRYVRPFASAPPSHAAEAVAAERRSVVRRAPAVLDLRAPPVAVWGGEVLVVAGPELAELAERVWAAGGFADPRLRVAAVGPPTGVAHMASKLAAPAARGDAVLALARLTRSGRALRSLEVLRRAVSRWAPCRTLWLDGRPPGAVEPPAA